MLATHGCAAADNRSPPIYHQPTPGAVLRVTEGRPIGRARAFPRGPRGRGARANAAKRSGGGAPVEVTDVDQTLLGVSNGALERTRERLAEADATRVDTNMDAGVDGYAHDDEGERDDGVRPRGCVGSRPGAARAGSPHPRCHHDAR